MDDKTSSVPMFGELAVEMAFITRSQLDAALARQEKLRNMLGIRTKLADMLIEQGMITPNQRDQILARQAGKRVIGNYELLKKLGEGGMGAVFLALQISMDRQVALKILSPELANIPRYRDRFLSEARAVARLDHMNIVRGYDVGHADGYYYFAMEYVPGTSLSDQIRGGKTVPVKRTLEIGRQCADALKHASDRGIIHRDIKPDNLLVAVRKTPSGRKGFDIKIADLGLAWFTEFRADTDQPQKVFGTPHYLSPEQAMGKGDLNFKSDIYSLGLTLYRLLTGKRPFEKKTPRGAMIAHLNETLPSPKEIRPKIPDALCRILENMTAKKREYRYPSWDMLIEDLQAALKGAGAHLHALGLPPGLATVAPPKKTPRPRNGYRDAEYRLALSLPASPSSTPRKKTSSRTRSATRTGSPISKTRKRRKI